MIKKKFFSLFRVETLIIFSHSPILLVEEKFQSSLMIYQLHILLLVNMLVCKFLRKLWGKMKSENPHNRLYIVCYQLFCGARSFSEQFSCVVFLRLWVCVFVFEDTERKRTREPIEVISIIVIIYFFALSSDVQSRNTRVIRTLDSTEWT